MCCGSNSEILKARGTGNSQVCNAAGRSAALFWHELSAAQRESGSARGGGTAIGEAALVALASPDMSKMVCIDSAQPTACGAAEGLVQLFGEDSLALATHDPALRSLQLLRRCMERSLLHAVPKSARASCTGRRDRERAWQISGGQPVSLSAAMPKNEKTANHR